MNYYISALKKYATFGGRAQRAEYWYFFLFNLIISNILFFGGRLLGAGAILYGLYLVGVIIPSIATSVRRLHDTGKSAWFLLVSLIPLVGFIWFFVLMVMDSKPGANMYGPNPKG